MPKRGAFKGGRNWNQGNRYGENKYDGEYLFMAAQNYAWCSAILCVCFFFSFSSFFARTKTSFAICGNIFLICIFVFEYAFHCVQSTMIGTENHLAKIWQFVRAQIVASASRQQAKDGQTMWNYVLPKWAYGPVWRMTTTWLRWFNHRKWKRQRSEDVVHPFPNQFMPELRDSLKMHRDGSKYW